MLRLYDISFFKETVIQIVVSVHESHICEG
jgi:hypothetical protein